MTMMPMPDRARRPVGLPSRRTPQAAPSGGVPLEPTYGGGGGISASTGRDLAELMDNALGGAPAQRIALSGPAAAGFAASVGSLPEAEAMLAGVYWWALLRTKNHASELVGDSSTAQILVSHAQGTRFNLLVFDHAGPEEPVARPVLADAAAILDVLRPNTRTAVDRITDRYPKMAHDQIVAAVAEIANVLDFGVVVVQSPDTEDTCRPDTAMPVRSAPGGPHVSSVGLLFDFDGEHYATTALHAVRDAPGPVWISGVAGTVTVKGPVTDSCLIQLSRRPPSAFSVPFGGVYDGVAPAQWDLARFTRYDQLGEIETQVLGTDMSAFDPDSDGMVRSYTPPVTIPTDSGVALRDLQDRVIGFAHRRSKRQARAQFSSWSWAAQAVTELGITHVWKGGCHGMGLVV